MIFFNCKHKIQFVLLFFKKKEENLLKFILYQCYFSYGTLTQKLPSKEGKFNNALLSSVANV